MRAEADQGGAARAPSDRVPMGVKLTFGFANTVHNLVNNLTKELIPPVFVVALGVSPALVALVLMVFRIVDALLAPVMGWISDNTRTRWGRRRPYLLCGALMCALCMPLMWQAKPGWSSAVLTCWMIAIGLLLNVAATIYVVPLESFMLELTPDYQERTRVMSVKMLVTSLSGPLIGWAWYVTQLPMFADPLTGRPDTLAGARALSLGVAVIILLAGVAPALLARERYYVAASRQARVSLLGNLSSAFRNPPFLMLAGICTLAVTASALSASLSFYTHLYYLCQGDQHLASLILGTQSTLFLVVSAASVLMFQRLSARLGKTRTLAIALAVLLASMLGRWWLLRPDMPWLCMVDMALVAIGVTGMWQILPAMNADTVDDEELRSATRREGAMASVFSWFVRLSFALGYGLPGVIVSASHFVVNDGAHQAPGVLTALRLWETLLPAALTAMALVLLLRYPLSSTRVAAIRHQLEQRRGLL